MGHPRQYENAISQIIEFVHKFEICFTLVTELMSEIESGLTIIII